MLKKSKLYIGISLIVQSISFLILFLSFRNKKKSLAVTFLATALTGGAVGALCLFSHSKNEAKYKRMKTMDDAYRVDQEEKDAFSEDEFEFESGAADEISITFDDIDLNPEDDETRAETNDDEPEIEVEYIIEPEEGDSEPKDIMNELEDELKLIDSEEDM